MTTIFKYPIIVGNEPTITIAMPVGAQVLSFADQCSRPTIWALVDPDAATENRRFLFAPTGGPIAEPPDRLKFIGTALFHSGSLVFHLFEVTP